MESGKYLETYMKFKKECLDKGIFDITEIIKLYEAYCRLELKL